MFFIGIFPLNDSCLFNMYILPETCNAYIVRKILFIFLRALEIDRKASILRAFLSRFAASAN
jgi:hypothetical protein